MSLTTLLLILKIKRALSRATFIRFFRVLAHIWRIFSSKTGSARSPPSPRKFVQAFAIPSAPGNHAGELHDTTRTPKTSLLRLPKGLL